MDVELWVTLFRGLYGLGCAACCIVIHDDYLEGIGEALSGKTIQEQRQ
jgi:hypothetical protein